MATVHTNPFRSYNRLESQTRLEDFERSLRCEVHDPLWMLGRQWQFGELQGEDTGSAIFAKVLTETTPILRYELLDGQAHAYAQEQPFEAIVEQFSMPEDYYDCTKGARYFLQLLDAHLTTEAGYQRAAYLQKLQSFFPLSLPIVEIADNAERKVQKSQLLTNEKLVSFLAAVQHWTFNTARLYQKIVSDISFLVSGMLIQESHWAKLTIVVNQFKSWHERRYPTPTGGAWDQQQLEHRFTVAAPAPPGANTTVLQASEYAQGELEWYHFDKVKPDTGSAGLKNSTPTDQQKIQKKALTLLPVPARYSGMPASRWWEFENGSVNLTLASAGETDLARLLVAQYSLIYSNDWLIVPFAVPNGTLAEVKGIVVTDTFGIRTLIRPAAQGQTANWQSWGMYNLSGSSAYEAADSRTLIPPTSPPTLNGDPLEAVYLLRDEMANMVWGLEVLISNQLGGSQDAYRAAQVLAERLLELDPSLSELSAEAIEDTVLDYTLATTVPENWIPFVPTHDVGQQRSIRLQRASMPRWFAQTYTRSRPRTLLLRPGMEPLTGADGMPAANPTQDQQQVPYFIHEEEVTRVGIKVDTRAKRARWYDGKIIQWTSRRKTSGRGEASSGLLFDAVKWVK